MLSIDAREERPLEKEQPPRASSALSAVASKEAEMAAAEATAAKKYEYSILLENEILFNKSSKKKDTRKS